MFRRKRVEPAEDTTAATLSELDTDEGLNAALARVRGEDDPFAALSRGCAQSSVEPQTAAPVVATAESVADELLQSLLSGAYE